MGQWYYRYACVSCLCLFLDLLQERLFPNIIKSQPCLRKRTNKPSKICKKCNFAYIYTIRKFFWSTELPPVHKEMDENGNMVFAKLKKSKLGGYKPDWTKNWKVYIKSRHPDIHQDTS
ncbi:hypothetical protein EDB81DRAFT_806561 [Dactylonectria macrodidyma]|uniref:Uncharacterized protein n=1 Tax=Dactylonectria macrodidyma TaxID=307937 RepID=A0A9P9E937_9HYPO|nr:hypothetical protein EDB81DRAFT_806561 [Dactylonectria macrodidyma]